MIISLSSILLLSLNLSLKTHMEVHMHEMRHSKIYLFSINGNVASDKIVDIYKMKHIELG